MNNFSALILAQLDDSKLQKDLQKVQKQPLTFDNVKISNVKFDKSSIDALQAQLDNLTANVSIKLTGGSGGAGGGLGKQITNAINSEINSSTLQPAKTALQSLQKSLVQNHGMKNSAVNSIMQGISNSARDANIQITKVSESFKSAGKNAGQLQSFKISGIDDLGNAVTIIDTFDKKTGQLKETTTTVNKTFADMLGGIGAASAQTKQKLEEALNVNLKNGKFSTDLNAVNKGMMSIQTTSVSLQSNVRELNSAFYTMRDSTDMGERIKAMQTYQSLLPGVRSEIAQLTRESKEAAEALALSDKKNAFGRKIQDEIKNLIPTTQKFKSELENIQNQIASADKSQLGHLQAEFNKVVESIHKEEKAVRDAAKAQETLSKSSTLSNNIQKWMNDNEKAAEKYGAELDELKKKLDNNMDGNTLKNVGLRFREIKSEAAALNLSTTDLRRAVKSLVTDFLGIGSAFAALQTAIGLARKMYDEVVKVDTAMTNLYKVTDETEAKYKQFLTEAGHIAQDLGKSTSDVIEQTAEWAKLGYTLEQAKELSKTSAVYANVGEVNNEDAVGDLVTSMKAFNIEAENSMDIVDKLNKLGNEFAVSSGGLGAALKRSASSLSVANVDINKSLAMITGGSEITQSPEEFGNFMKIAVMRIRGIITSCLHMGKVHMPCCA